MSQKTVKELADELEVTKQAIQYHLKNIDSDLVDKRDDGAFLINPTIENFIRKKMNKPQQNTDKSSPKESQNSNKRFNDYLLAENERLNNKIDDLNKQIKEMTDDLVEITNRNQDITEQSHRLVSQQQQIQYSSDTNEKVLDNSPKTSSEEKGFFKRLFNL